jgi:acetyl-CoA C-acetyltransferase
MPDAYILSACRTPIGKFRGALSSLPATELGAIAVREAVARAGVDAADINEVICGNVLSAGVGQAPARQAALRGGLPPKVAAVTVNKVCGSGLKAAMLAAQGIRCGDVDLVVAGGMESMSQAGWVLPREAPPVGDRQMIDSMLHDGLTCAFSNESMGQIADDLARRLNISREDQDRFALESHRRAVAAIDAGAFAAETVPITVRRGADELVVAQDEGPRRDTSLERLAKLKPSFGGHGTVTAGNSSMISDGAAAVVVGSKSAAVRLGRRPLARIVASATSGGEPHDLFTAPVDAIRKVLAKAGRSPQEIDLFEINEAFAVQMLACMRQLELPPERVNIQGGAIALGHPIGASGARVLVTLLYAMERRNAHLGVAALCLGGGNAVAMLVERFEGRTDGASEDQLRGVRTFAETTLTNVRNKLRDLDKR